MTQESTQFKNIYQKLLVVQQRIQGLGKDKATYSYKYVTGDKVLGLIKPIMNEVGLILKQEVLSIENIRQDYATKAGSKSEINSKVMMKFTWVDTDTGQTDENMFGANGQNDWDKGVGSALTYGERYFLLKYFHIATDEDDIDNPERKPQEKAQPQQREKAQPAAEAEALDAERKVTAFATSAQKEEIIHLLNDGCITSQEKTKMLLNVGKLDFERAAIAIAKLKATIEQRTGKPFEKKEPVKDSATEKQRELITKLAKSHVITEDEREEIRLQCESDHFTVAEAAALITQLQQALQQRKADEKQAA